jgi:hypothetical protein
MSSNHFRISPPNVWRQNSDSETTDKKGNNTSGDIGISWNQNNNNASRTYSHHQSHQSHQSHQYQQATIKSHKTRLNKSKLRFGRYTNNTNYTNPNHTSYANTNHANTNHAKRYSSKSHYPKYVVNNVSLWQVKRWIGHNSIKTYIPISSEDLKLADILKTNLADEKQEPVIVITVNEKEGILHIVKNNAALIAITNIYNRELKQNKNIGRKRIILHQYSCLSQKECTILQSE